MNGDKRLLMTALAVVLFSITGWGLISIIGMKSDVATIHQEVDDIKAWMSKLDSKVDGALQR